MTESGRGAAGAVDRPRVLVTGFSVFPGAPVNPTERLVKRLAQSSDVDRTGFRAVVLPVEYDGMSARLAAIAEDFEPDIAIHFGLARTAQGFRLERIARNSLLGAGADNAGRLPLTDLIAKGPQTWPSTLPLQRIAAALEAVGLPVEWSDDAGNYLCNMVFALSRVGTCGRFAPPMSGFIHVPPIEGDAGPSERAIGEDALVKGAGIVIDVCRDVWTATR